MKRTQRGFSLTTALTVVIICSFWLIVGIVMLVETVFPLAVPFVSTEFIAQANEVCRQNRGLQVISPVPTTRNRFGTAKCMNGAEFIVRSAPLASVPTKELW